MTQKRKQFRTDVENTNHPTLSIDFHENLRSCKSSFRATLVSISWGNLYPRTSRGGPFGALRGPLGTSLHIRNQLVIFSRQGPPPTSEINWLFCVHPKRIQMTLAWYVYMLFIGCIWTCWVGDFACKSVFIVFYD